LDLLVDLAGEIGAAGGVIGSRMTGGGFGGCTATLVRTVAVEKVSETIRIRYNEATGIEPTMFATRPAAGAVVLESPRVVPSPHVAVRPVAPAAG
jgi:galactokinase